MKENKPKTDKRKEKLVLWIDTKGQLHLITK